ncbi:enoyl-CoA hydratase [Caldalkalibacillus mannanilyticus]|uniref:enoyl-CoA hydratase n=1 Tax=Caldalkalibacillus mannanilyticus TaxID=1418 RepID=UPI00046A5CF2|nr:enoyl-CoA hydratase [Caldalkalibacillus mannanilyticus]
MDFTHIHVEQMESVAILTLDHPPANALSQPTFSGLTEALDYVEKEASVKVIILKGNGKFFAAGADIKEFTTVSSAAESVQMAKIGQQVFARMEAFSKPIIAAIHGAALGGGLELAMACHIRFATPTAKLGLPELNLGLIPGFAGTQRLPKLIGKAKALELLFTSLPISGEEAQRLGLVNQCFAEEELFDKVLAFAQAVASKSAISLSYLLEAIRVGEEEGMAAGSEKEAELFGHIFETYDAKEGIQAFIEKRKPIFKDK